MITIRSYKLSDYTDVIALYKQPELYGGQFDEARDSEERLRKHVEADPDAIIVAEDSGEIVGTVSLIEDGRVAMLFRFCVVKQDNESEITTALYEKATEILKTKGHTQVLVYTPADNKNLHQRYEELKFIKGADYTCFWREF